MTTIRDNSRKPDSQGDDQTQPSKSPGEIESGDDGTTEAQGQRGVTTPMQPGRNERQDIEDQCARLAATMEVVGTLGCSSSVRAGPRGEPWK